MTIADQSTTTETTRRRGVRRHTTGAALAVLAVAAVGVGVWRAVTAPEAVPRPPSVSAELETLRDVRVFFAHQSVGANILDGLDAVAQGAVTVLQTSDPGQLSPGTVGHAYVGMNGDPQSKIDAFADIIEGGIGDSVDVAMLKLCYTDVTAGSDVEAIAASYLQELDRLDARYPDVRFIGVTVPLTTEPDWVDALKGLLGRGDGRTADDNQARQEFNELVRAHFSADGTLLDIADVESVQGRAVHEKDGVEYYALSSEYASDTGHLNARGAHAAAAEFVRVVAADAGSR